MLGQVRTGCVILGQVMPD